MEFISEIGLNHNGNFNLIYEMIRQSKFSGADIAKFQLGWRGKEDEMNYFDAERTKKVKDWCDYFEIGCMFSVFTPESFELYKKVVNPEAYKIASRTVKDDYDLVKRVLDEGKKTYVSLGMWEKEELPFNPADYPHLNYLYCKSKYPSEPWDMVDLPKNFKESPYTGYSDHTIGIDTALLAIARGATVIEKHFTLDKSDVTIRDHALSSTPDEFRLLTEIGREMYKKLQLGV